MNEQAGDLYDRVGPVLQTGAVGDDVDFDVFVLVAIIFDHVGGVTQHQVHELRIVLVNLNGNAMRLAVGRGAG